jgi:hypothetical protein
MFRKLLFVQFVLILFSPIISGQVRVRIFANKPASSGVFTVTAGKYELDVYDGKTLSLTIGEPVVLAMFNSRIAVKDYQETNVFHSGLTAVPGTDNFTAVIFNVILISVFWFL